MMTYRALKIFINGNTQPNNKKIFDLISTDIKSKIILVVGDRASNTASFLTSIMNACGLSYVHYTNNKDLTPFKRFFNNTHPISMDMICEKAEEILKATKRTLSNNDLFFSLALHLSNDEYTVIEMDEDYYYHTKDHFSPFALILTLDNDTKIQSIINDAPSETKEIISLSNQDDFDYISTKTNKNGARITFASPNKIIVSNAALLSTSFYHYSYLYHISALDLNNVSVAHLAIESASIVFNAPRPYIYKGLDSAKLPHDLTLYSLSPTILLREGKNDFKLHHRLKFKIVDKNIDFSIPAENTVFCGDKEYINNIKEQLKKR